MKAFLILILCLTPSWALTQSANFEDDFSDRDLSGWSGDVDDFEFHSENRNILLHQSAAVPGSSQLSIPSTQITGYWEFFIRMEEFSPSDGNKVLIYLMSDRADLNTAVNGYMLQAGENGSGDVFRIFRVSNGQKDQEIVTGITSISEGGDYRIKVTRSSIGEWQLAVSKDYYEAAIPEATGFDDRYTSATHFGFQTIYTSTRRDRFYFDFKIDPPPIEPLVINQLEINTQKKLQLHFNKAIDPTSVDLFSIFIEPANQHPSSFIINPDSLLELEFDSDFAAGENILSVSSVFDLAHDTTLSDTTLLFLNVSSPGTGDLVINEILYDPLSDPDDFLQDQAEYIEVYNPGTVAYSMKDIFLTNAPDENQHTDALYPEEPDAKWIAPLGHFLIYAEQDTSLFAASNLARFFSLDDEDEKFSMRIDRAGLSLSASGDAVYLRSLDGVVIDSVHYDESWHNPNLYSTDGIALEKIYPRGASNDPANWSSSTHPSGGTPRYRNSIHLEPLTPPDASLLSFSPNPFSPDGDGFEDFLAINYTLNETDYLITVRIFDRYGRMVRKLADQFPAGPEGTLIWDGLRDDRTVNRIGIYIVLLEAFNSATGKHRSFKETVVLARQR